MCCRILNNVDVLSYTLLGGVNEVMEKGIDYISKLLDKNSSFSIGDRIPVPPPVQQSTSSNIPLTHSPSHFMPSPTSTTQSPIPSNIVTSLVTASPISLSTSILSFTPSLIATLNPMPSHSPPLSPDNNGDRIVSIVQPSVVINLPGTNPNYPAESCANVTGPSGEYWIGDSSETASKLFCETENERLKGMARIVNINMTKPNSSCPPGLKTVEVGGKKLCGRGTTGRGCSSVFFNTSGIQYSKVCGSIRGYQYSSPNAFYWFTRNPKFTIDDIYVDGVVLTYSGDDNKRRHLWTFVGAIDEVARNGAPFACECTNINDKSEIVVPSFVGNNYFCETGSRNTFEYKKYYLDDPLWDGKGCGPSDTCCDRGDLFCTTLEEPTFSDIELRICGNEDLNNEDTPLDKIELYIQ